MIKAVAPYYKYIKDAKKLENLFKQSYAFVKNKLSNISNSHSFDHTLRVTWLTLSIGKELGAALDVLALSAIFHDVARPIEKLTGKCHAKEGARIASEFLKEYCPIELVNEVSEAILSHRFSLDIEPKTLEGKILKDADMLDALGAVGLYRLISYGVEHGREITDALKHFDDKLFILPSKMHFPITKKMAEERVKMLRLYYLGIKEDIKQGRLDSIIDELMI